MSEYSQRLTQTLRQKILDIFTPLVPRDRPFVLIDFPDAANSGDHAIWLGEKAFFKDLGVEPAYQCSMQSYDRAEMTRALADGVIFMHGGDNFGDAYIYHEFRHQVLLDFPDNEVVIFPQTVMFYSDPKLLGSVEQFARHGKVTIAARDALSFHVLEKFFGSHCKIIMAPDMAYMLGPQRRNGNANFEVLWLSRTDSEGVHGGNIAKVVNLPNLGQVTANLGQFVDRIETVALADVSGSKLIVTDWYRCQFANQAGVDAYRNLSLDQQSKFWVDRALTLLSSGSVVITDRLHAHILCTLVGIPHILLNNVYGKNISFYETWSRPLDVCHLASSPEHAWGIAQDFLKRVATQRAQQETRPVA